MSNLMYVYHICFDVPAVLWATLSWSPKPDGLSGFTTCHLNTSLPFLYTKSIYKKTNSREYDTYTTRQVLLSSFVPCNDNFVRVHCQLSFNLPRIRKCARINLFE